MYSGERLERCPVCSRTMAGVRHGIHLGPVGLRIFDAIKRAGRYGITSSELQKAIYADRSPKHPQRALWAYIRHINTLLESSDVKIVGRAWHGYRLVKR